MAAGLGEKKVVIPNLHCSWIEFKADLCTASYSYVPYVENFGGGNFWRIITDEAIGEEKFGESAVISRAVTKPTKVQR